MEKQQILNDVLGAYERKNNEFLYYCPKCNHHKRKLSVNVHKGAFKCWICEFSGNNLGFLVKKYGSYDQYVKWKSLTPSYAMNHVTEVVEKPPLRLPEEFVSLCTNEERAAHRPAKNYLTLRGLTKEDIFKWKIGFCYTGNYRNRIIIPSFNQSGDLTYFVARSFTGSSNKYFNPPASKDIIFNDLMIDWSQPVVLVEGVFDAVRIPNAIPILGSTLQVGSRLFQRIISESATVYIALDNDAQQKEERIIKNLLLYNVKVYKMNLPDGSDVGDLTSEQCKQIKQKAHFVENTDYLLYRKILGGI